MRRVLAPIWPNAVWSFGKLELNDFSICIPAERTDVRFGEGVYVKIPKRRSQTRSIDQIDEADQRFGGSEAASLTALAEAWPIGDGVRYVEMLGHIEERNVLVTRRVYGEDFSVRLRRLDFTGRLKHRKADQDAVEALRRVGRSLASFHRATRREGGPTTKVLMAKFGRYGGRLREFGVAEESISRILQIASPWMVEDTPGFAAGALTLKGLDVRNLLAEPEGRLVFLDPGALKVDSPLADHARFSATIRLLYWGKLAFFLGMYPRAEYMDAFDQGYFGGQRPSASKIYELKELCKMWLMAHAALRGKPWPRLLKSALRATYIDRFFTSWIAELEREPRNG